MSVNERRWLRTSIVASGVLLACILCAPRARAQSAACSMPSCVTMTLNINVQLTNLHPTVSHFMIQCSASNNSASYRNNHAPSSSTPDIPVVNRGYAGSVSIVIFVPTSILVDPPDRTLDTACDLWLKSPTGIYKRAAPTATQPLAITAPDWMVVGAGSAVRWTQQVTMPNATP
jgi:hypothetical protein